MALNWDIVGAEHVREACRLVASGAQRPRAKAKGIFLVHDGNPLPAKHVLRLAYLLAKRLPLDTKVRFSSGEGTVKRLQKLGFEAARVDPRSTPQTGTA